MSDKYDQSPGKDSARNAGPDVTDAAGVLANWNYSMAAFYLKRGQQYWQLPLQLMQAVSPQQLIEIRLDFEGRLLADYAEQAAHLWRMVHADERKLPPEDYEASLLKAQQHAALIIDQAKAQAQRIIASAHAQADEMIADGAKQASSEVRRRSATA